MARLVRRIKHRWKHNYQCCICGERDHRVRICCGHLMIALRPNWDLLDWDIMEWKKRGPKGGDHESGE